MSEIDKAPDLDVIAAKKELETRIHKVLVKLPGLIRHRLKSTSLWNIAGCMNVTENTYDIGRLPVYYQKPFAPRPKKYDCLRALATFVIVKWWDYSLGRNTTPYPTAYLDQLDRIIELGLDAFKVTGAYEGGFRLVTCKKCNDTGIDRNEVDEDGRSTGCSCDCPIGVARDEHYADENNLDNDIGSDDADLCGRLAKGDPVDEEPDTQEGEE